MPRKNCLLFNGKPLIEWSINFAQRANVFSSIVVSTDDEEITRIAKRAGAHVVARPQEFSSDTSPTIEAVLHAYQNDAEVAKADYICVLQPTNPLRPQNLMQQIMERKLLPEHHSSLMTVSKCELKLGRKQEESGYLPINYALGQRSQDMEHLFYENGLLYVVPAKLISEGKLFGEKIITLETEKRFSVDIDDLIDFKIAEILFQANQEELNYLL